MIIHLTRFSFLLIFSLLLLFPLYGQEGLSTDRPDATEGTHVMSPGVLQLELGYNSSSYEGDALDETFKSKGFGALIRFGLFKNMEFRLGLDQSKLTNSLINSELSGLGPIVIGLKTKFKEEGKYCPAISFLGSLALSGTGGENLKIENSAPAFRFLLSKELNSNFSLAVNVGMEWNGFDASATRLSTLSLGVALTDWLGSYLELESYYNTERSDEHIFNFGFTIWLESNSQLDFGYGFGISDAAIEKQWTLGFTERLFK